MDIYFNIASIVCSATSPYQITSATFGYYTDPGCSNLIGTSQFGLPSGGNAGGTINSVLDIHLSSDIDVVTYRFLELAAGVNTPEKYNYTSEGNTTYGTVSLLAASVNGSPFISAPSTNIVGVPSQPNAKSKVRFQFVISPATGADASTAYFYSPDPESSNRGR